MFVHIFPVETNGILWRIYFFLDQSRYILGTLCRVFESTPFYVTTTPVRRKHIRVLRQVLHEVVSVFRERNHRTDLTVSHQIIPISVIESQC